MSPEHVADLARLHLTKPQSYAILKWAENWIATNQRQLIPPGGLASQEQINAIVSCGWQESTDLNDELLVLCFAAWVHADGDNN